MSIRKRTWPGPAGEERTAWVVDYRDNGGKRRSKQFKRKRDAETWLTMAAWQVAQGVHTPDSQSVTVGDAAADWLRRAEREGLEEVTQRSYRTRYSIHIARLFTDLAAFPQVAAYYARLAERPAFRAALPAPDAAYRIYTRERYFEPS